MKRRLRWGALPTAILVTLATVTTAYGNPIDIPLRSSPLVVNGVSGGPQSSDCGYISNRPNEVIRVTEAFSSLEFVLESSGEPTLLITNSDGFHQCVIADDLSGGRIDVPGLWDEGTYSVYVGDRAGGQHDYTLTIRQ